MIQVILNGQATEINTPSLLQLLETYQLKQEYVVVEIDGEIIERANWEKVELQAGQKIELVHFVGGG